MRRGPWCSLRCHGARGRHACRDDDGTVCGAKLPARTAGARRACLDAGRVIPRGIAQQSQCRDQRSEVACFHVREAHGRGTLRPHLTEPLRVETANWARYRPRQSIVTRMGRDRYGLGEAKRNRATVRHRRKAPLRSSTASYHNVRYGRLEGLIAGTKAASRSAGSRAGARSIHYRTVANRQTVLLA